MRVHIFQNREEIGMKLWTVQPVEAINIIEKTGAFTCDETKSDKDFRKAYEWIAKEMGKRQITHPKDLTLPLWAWHTRDWKHKNRILEISDLVHRAKNLYVSSLRLMICKFCYPTFSPGILF